MKGTLTYHLPLRRGPETPPEVTVIVRRTAEDQWHAGLAVCSRGDQFVKRLGRAIATGRLGKMPLVAPSPPDLMMLLQNRFETLVDRRPGTLTQRVLEDLHHLVEPLSKMRIE